MPMSQKNILFRLFPLFICVVGIIANGENMVSMGECESPPVINGSLDDQCWKYCMEITGFVIPVKLNYARDQTSVRFCHDGRMLYGSVICYQKNSDKLRQGAKSKDAAQMWTENGIEMFFIPGTNFDQYLDSQKFSGGCQPLKAGIPL